MKVHVFQTGVLSVNTCIIPLAQNKVLVVDPADMNSGSRNSVLSYLESNKLDCVAVLLTHGHFDHITGLAPIKAAFPDALIAIHKNDSGELGKAGVMNVNILEEFGMDIFIKKLSEQPAASVLLKGGETLDSLFGEDVFWKAQAKEWKVIHTPGHSPGSVCFYNEKEKILISGDTLFYGSWGRVDMYGGNDAEIHKSLNLLKETVSADSKVFPGHGEFGFEMQDSL